MQKGAIILADALRLLEVFKSLYLKLYKLALCILNAGSICWIEISQPVGKNASRDRDRIRLKGVFILIKTRIRAKCNQIMLVDNTLGQRSTADRGGYT